jgi:DNA-binding transcriptional MerR regulator
MAVVTIGELSRKAGVTTRTLRFYEQKGLLSPQKSGVNGTVRLFTETDQRNLTVIRQYQRLGFSLDEIATLHRDEGRIPLAQHAIRQQIEQLEQHQAHTAATIAELKTLIEEQPVEEAA